MQSVHGASTRQGHGQSLRGEESVRGEKSVRGEESVRCKEKVVTTRRLARAHLAMGSGCDDAEPYNMARELDSAVDNVSRSAAGK